MRTIEPAGNTKGPASAHGYTRLECEITALKGRIELLEKHLPCEGMVPYRTVQFALITGGIIGVLGGYIIGDF